MNPHAPETGSPITITQLDEHVRHVAQHLSIPFNLSADMSGTFTLQIDLGMSGTKDDPHDMAGIDPGTESVWWVDFGGGQETQVSKLGPQSTPEHIAQWITSTVHQHART